MSDRIFTKLPLSCQLVGGPFDGDKGGCVPPLPDRMYVWGCKTPPAFCPSKGIHWDKVLKMAESEVYVHTEERDGVEIYVHEDLEMDKPRYRTRADHKREVEEAIA